MTPRPDYSRNGIELYCADCRDILPHLSGVDAVVTDPPYGVGFQYESHVDSLDTWKLLMSSLVQWCQSNVAMAVLPSCQIKQLRWIYTNHPPDWLICWYKGSPGHAAYIGFNDWEPLLVYGKRPGLQMHDYFFCSPEPFDNGHPCPKPIGWALWLVCRVVLEGQTILDPFMGSGTTGVACIRTGRKFIGIEREQKYFDIAVKRIEAEFDRAPLFAEQLKETQSELFGESAP